MNARKKVNKLILDLLSEMEEERDEFASGFAEWLNSLTPSQKCTVHPPSGSGGTTGLYDRTIGDLLEQYKKTL